MQSLSVMLGGFINMTGDAQCQRIDGTNIIYALRLEEDGYSGEILYDMRLAEGLKRVENACMGFVCSKHRHRHTA